MYTLGFAKKSAEEFFEVLKRSQARSLVDVRLNNTSQLAGFTQKRDLPYFLKTICAMDYEHMPVFAPTRELLNAYRNGDVSWAAYERAFLELMDTRNVAGAISPASVANSVLLCSEPTPERCHRRLVAQYLNDRWSGLEIIHL